MTQVLPHPLTHGVQFPDREAIVARMAEYMRDRRDHHDVNYKLRERITPWAVRVAIHEMQILKGDVTIAVYHPAVLPLRQGVDMMTAQARIQQE